MITQELGGRNRRVCPASACGYVAWNNPIPVVAGIVEREGGVFLVRSHGWPETWYGLVAGFLEGGETPEQGVLREVEEELGLTPMSAPRLIGSYPFEQMNQIIFTYHLEAAEGEIRLCERELADYRFVPLAKLKPWSRGTGPALRDWLVERGYEPETAEFGEHIVD
jgi:NADH pyrophosphatase NudC (nudix superfamily)